MPVRVQVLLQLVLVGSVFLVMPVTVDEATVQRLTTGHPTAGILLVLLRTIGLPFFVLSTSSPLLQRWFAELGERDPYHLYAASNAGSMVALFGYPLVVEPLLAVRAQSRLFQAAFVAYTLFVVVCALNAVRRPSAMRVDTTPAPPQVRVTSTRPSALSFPSSRHDRWRERLVWLGLSFAPSSLLLGATEYVTTDIASVPLLWVLPLALYLMSFILAFAKRQIVSPAIWSQATALVAALVAALTIADVTGPPWLVIAAHMMLLFLASVVCHRGLATRRPHVSRLTEFYLLLSIGGVLGGAFNGLVAPHLFDDLVEYPIAVGLACVGRAAIEPKEIEKRSALFVDVALGLAVGLGTYALVKVVSLRRIEPMSGFGWALAIPLILTAVWSSRPVRHAVAVSGVLLAAMSYGGQLGATLWADRSFFGVLKVMREREGRFLLLVSGRAMQGKQAIDGAAARVPLAYYHPTGPAGEVLGPLPGDASAENAKRLASRRVGVIGLGVGSLAAYARTGDDWTFFEINPAVVDVARRYFSYLEAAEERAAIHVEMGDARLRLRQGAPARFDVLVLDAFSSDAIPTHLVTREALTVYRRALRPGGVILAHVTNDHVHLAPVFAALAKQAGLVALVRRDDAPSREARASGKDPSEWVLLTETRAASGLGSDASEAWRSLEAAPLPNVWTDDYANVLGALRF